MYKIKLVLTDIDGVWTDGGMYYNNSNDELKKFHTYDSAGVLFCKLLHIPVGIITGEQTEIVERRANKLKIDYLYQGVKDKLAIANTICADLGISLLDTAYIGDDINDIRLLQGVRLSAAPQNAPEYVKQEVNHVTTKSGGQGAFREFVEYILNENGTFDTALNLYLNGQNDYDQ